MMMWSFSAVAAAGAKVCGLRNHPKLWRRESSDQPVAFLWGDRCHGVSTNSVWNTTMLDEYLMFLLILGFFLGFFGVWKNWGLDDNYSIIQCWMILEETCTSQNLMLMPGRVKPPIREGAGTLRGALSALGHFWRQQRYGRFQQPKLVFQTVFWKKLTKSKLGQKKILGSSMSKVFGLFFGQLQDSTTKSRKHHGFQEWKPNLQSLAFGRSTQKLGWCEALKIWKQYAICRSTDTSKLSILCSSSPNIIHPPDTWRPTGDHHKWYPSTSCMRMSLWQFSSEKMMIHHQIHQHLQANPWKSGRCSPGYVRWFLSPMD